MHDAEPAASLRRDRRTRRRLQLRHRAARAPRDGRDRGRGAHDRLGSRWPPSLRLLPRQLRCRGVRGTRLSPDARRIVAGQGARATAYGLGSVLIGVTLARRGLSAAEVGVVLAALLAGAALVSVLLARHGDRFGRRRSYRLLFVAMAVAGTVFALTDWLPALIAAALTGTISTDVIESGPFTSLEQAMLPHVAGEQGTTRLFGTYNTVATLAGLARRADRARSGRRRTGCSPTRSPPARGCSRPHGCHRRSSSATSWRQNRCRRCIARAESSGDSRRSSRSTASAAASCRRRSSPTCSCASTTPRRRRSPSSSSRSASSRRSRFRERSGWRAGSACCGRWSSRTCPRTCCSPRSRSPRTSHGDRAPARPLRALAGGRAHAAGVRRRRRRPERAHGRRRIHEHRALPDSAASRRYSPARRSEAGSASPFLLAGALKSVYDIGLYLLFRRVPIRPSSS